jgi:ArsR family transcriptional regulator, arsenate/arsenite/antimonite-responsive transcriptional repressor
MIGWKWQTAIRLRRRQLAAFSVCRMTLSARLESAMDAKKIEKISKALGDQTRLRIYEVIAAQKNLTCSELVTMQGVTPATISHHLKILTDAELIECRKEGQFVYSRTVPETIAGYTKSLVRISRGSRTARSRKEK